MTNLNKRLIDEQGLSDGDVEELERLHEHRARMFDKMADLDPTNAEDKDTLILYSHLLESLEYNMQRVWKFPQDQDYHSWWYQVPHCKCPNMDNSDVMYRGLNIYAGDCPIHGHHVEVHVEDQTEPVKEEGFTFFLTD